MKPLPIAPATEEDEAIWWRVTRGTFPFDAVMCSALVNPDSDRRDAELMLAARVWRAGGGPTLGIAVAYSNPPRGSFRLAALGPFGGNL